MNNVSFKWLSIGALCYIGSAILASVVFSISLVLIFDHIPAAQLATVEPTASILKVGETLIGFTLALYVARFVVEKTDASHPFTIWMFAGFLTIYGIISVVIHYDGAVISALPKLLAPWIVATIAIKWQRSIQTI